MNFIGSCLKINKKSFPKKPHSLLPFFTFSKSLCFFCVFVSSLSLFLLLNPERVYVEVAYQNNSTFLFLVYCINTVRVHIYIYIYIPFVLVVLNLLKEIGEHETTLHMKYNKKKCICILCCTVKTRSGVKQIEVMNINSQKPIAFGLCLCYMFGVLSVSSFEESFFIFFIFTTHQTHCFKQKINVCTQI